MGFIFDSRQSDSPLVESVWRTQSIGGGSFISTAVSHWEMVVTKQEGKITFSLRGPETLASPAPIPEDAEFLGIIFKRGVFMPHFPKTDLVNTALHLPESLKNSFSFSVERGNSQRLKMLIRLWISGCVEIYWRKIQWWMMCCVEDQQICRCVLCSVASCMLLDSHTKRFSRLTVHVRRPAFCKVACQFLKRPIRQVILIRRISRAH